MDFFETVEKRFSAREYRDKKINETDLRRILETATRAPSAGNVQAYRIVVVRDSQRKRQLAHAALDQSFVARAPVVLVFAIEPLRAREKYGRRGAELYCLQDATIACAYAQLAATALGLGSCWVGAFDESAVASILNLPAGYRPIALLPIGYPAESAPTRQRRPFSELVYDEPTQS